jgi:hypothetical protein
MPNEERKKAGPDKVSFYPIFSETLFKTLALDISPTYLP